MAEAGSPALCTNALSQIFLTASCSRALRSLSDMRWTGVWCGRAVIAPVVACALAECPGIGGMGSGVGAWVGAVAQLLAKVVETLP